VPLENVLQLVPGRAPGTYTIQSALQDYAWRSALRGLTGISIDPMTGQPGVLPQIMQWLSLAGTSLPGVLTFPVATVAQFPSARWIMQLLLDLLNIGGENNEDNNQYTEGAVRMAFFRAELQMPEELKKQLEE